MARVTWLPEVLRAAGLRVNLVGGWRDRGKDDFRPVAVVCHATAGRLTPAQDIHVLLNGSTTAPPPISQLFLDRTGTWWVVATGKCNHIGDAKLPGTGEAGNDNAVGIEAANDNKSEPWPKDQYNSYVRGVAAICRHMGWDTDQVFGHKEISSTGKTDPTFGMDTFRQKVKEVMSGASGGTGFLDALTPAEQREALEGIRQLLTGSITTKNANILWARRAVDGADAAVNTVWKMPPGVGIKQVYDRLGRLEEKVSNGGVDVDALADAVITAVLAKLAKPSS